MTPSPFMDKCYACKHRAEIAGSAHSRCQHPATEEDSGKAGLIGLLDLHAANRPTHRSNAAECLEISAVPQGIRGGWFLWPYNFDPVWLTNCTGYEAVK